VAIVIVLNFLKLTSLPDGSTNTSGCQSLCHRHFKL